MTAEADLLLHGTDLFGELAKPTVDGVLKQKFVFPPFSVLNSRTDEWQERKRQWISLGIKSELGRGENLLNFSDAALHGYKAGPAIPGGGTGKNSAWLFKTEEGYESGDAAQAGGSGTSIFDPVLCELCYRWWSAPGSQVLDPFAGGSVRGLLAAALGRRYWGSELRAEQVEANRGQAKEFRSDPMPTWVEGDSLVNLPGAPAADFVFSCPPYGSLERYSDDPRDLSAMTWVGFLAAYHKIIELSVGRLKNDRFAAFVVGDFRNDDGFYCHLVQETVSAFEKAGARLYNHAILVNAIGSGAMRATRIFGSNRKLVKLHQNVLQFVKGDPSRAAEYCKASSNE